MHKACCKILNDYCFGSYRCSRGQALKQGLLITYVTTFKHPENTSKDTVNYKIYKIRKQP